MFMRKSLSIIVGFVLLAVILTIAGVWQFKRVLNSLQIESFNYQLENLTLHKAIFSELSVVHKTETLQHTFHFYNVAADWSWRSWFSPQLNVINIEQAHVTQIKLDALNSQPVDNSSPIFSLPENWSVPESLPDHINIQQLTVTLPCAAVQCTFEGVANLTRLKVGEATSGIDFKLKANPDKNTERQIALHATYTIEKNYPNLTAQLNVGDMANLQLNTALKPKNETYWLGSIKGNAAYPDDWWLSYFKKWGIQIAPQPFEQEGAASNMNVATEWELALAPLINLSAATSTSEGIKALTGSWILDAKIPVPLMIENVGEFFGNANIDVDISAGKLNRYAFAADIKASKLVVPDDLKVRGVIADRMNIQINSNMDSAVSFNALPIVFSGETQGAIQSNLAGKLLVDVPAKKITVQQFNVAAKAKQLKPVAGLQLNNANATLQISGYWQPDKFELNVSSPNKISADVSEKSMSITAKAIQLETSQLNIAGEVAEGEILWPQLKLATDIQLKGSEFKHPQISAKKWYWQGKAKGSLADVEVNGLLGMGSSLVVEHKIKRNASELLLDWKVPSIFLLASNPYAEMLSVWPSLLTLSRGKMDASGNLVFNLEKNTLTRTTTTVQLGDISGVYDTLAFQGLDGQLKVSTKANNLDVSTEKFTVANINKGFDFGPLVASGKYAAALNKLTQGKLNLSSFSGSVMGGSLSTAAQQFDFSRATQKFKVEVKDVNLANLLKQYSPGELSGTGLLSGSVPIEINPKGIRIEQGAVAAVAPGGLLQMTSTRANAIAKNQPSMKLVVDALEDFHYTALASQVNYDEEGKLLLAIKLEGRNPALERGRPINLNVNLEEDVPAMLASIQLSGKVSDIVKKRLQSRVRENASDKEKLNAK
jgi:hypothetical protein